VGLKAAASVRVKFIQGGSTALDRDDLLIADDRNAMVWQVHSAIRRLSVCL
jgi:hypothetical protein